jgi:hypothetical protein
MKAEKLAYRLALVFLVGSCNYSHPNSLGQFKGMWRLDKYEALDSATGKWINAPKRIGYSGYILYDGSGHVGVQLMPPAFEKLNYSKSIDSLSIDQLRELTNIQSKSFVYFANCDILPGQNIIEHHIQSSNHPEEIGTTVKRNFEFRDDTLILTASELIGGSKTRLRWIKN